MDKFRIEQCGPLCGRIETSGAKNSCLPQMAAALLAESPVVLENTPKLMDVRTMSLVLENLGAAVSQTDQGALCLDPADAKGVLAPYELVRRMRASYYVMGPLLARHGRAEVSLPGGCAIGQRPIDLHLRGLAALGAQIVTSGGYVKLSAENGLTGAEIDLAGEHGSSVGATINVMMAAVLARGRTVIESAALEPEVEDVAVMLNAMGASVAGAGGSRIEIEGVRRLNGVTHRVIPDRIEAGTYAVAAAITGGDVVIADCRPDHLTAVIEMLERTGVTVEKGRKTLLVRSNGPLRPFELATSPYPGFPTDMQAQFCALATRCEGTSRIVENIFENRALHVPELARLGADIAVQGRTITINGPCKLTSAPVMASDLRASAALVLAAMTAEG
ncbi:MAG: UDP-N-acetylglucosamine 1-carboxyvinyltransferase, partial [Candidatus Glassbacteria bacterium]|nr:UDP-N-acetylglucosamine 1-carboxyvinyltransferase [Candidatus Glassbacteria bacterium]